MIGVETARRLIDFRGPNRSVSEEVALEELRGSVALHNILETKKVAYLADEVGMGKTYVALGAMALFRHFDPNFRVLVIAPRANIQTKWIKELRNFARGNVRFADLRIRAVHGAPARPAVSCHNLVDLVRETSLNPDRDFFVRMSSFSLPLGKSDSESWKKRRDELLRYLPWANRDAFNLHYPKRFKDNFARALGAALPVFDLVIVDEGHNLKHGFGSGVSSRNRVLALSFGGHASERGHGFPDRGPRLRRVLFLSATPLESDYAQLWNQLDIFGFGGVAQDLVRKDATDEERRACAQEFLIRRVTAMKVVDERLTKNQYRREWRGGGVASHDEPLQVPDERQRLIVALTQKKVSEILGHEKFNNSFQIGMLASFESFLQTSLPRRREPEEELRFDDPDQTEDLDERQGIDVGAVDGLAKSYLKEFNAELPHPKMDALVEQLAKDLPHGRKSLVFVRRVASVKELQRKLEERYDQQLIERLRQELPAGVVPRLNRAFAQYQEERTERRERQAVASVVEPDETGQLPMAVRQDPDGGGLDSFFAWYFRGDGPEGLLSGAALQRRFLQATAAYSTFFEDNYVAWLLDVPTGEVLTRLGEVLGTRPSALKEDLAARAGKLLPATTGQRQRIGRLHLFLAMQEAALALLAESGTEAGPKAQTILQALGGLGVAGARGNRAPEGIEQWLEEPTFFAELRQRPELRARLWSEPSFADFRAGFREQELRRLLLSATARLGHSFIDLYILAVGRLGGIEARVREDEGGDASRGLVRDYTERLHALSQSPSSFGAFQELALADEHFNLILDVNAPDLRSQPLSEAARLFGTLLGRQQPIGGMFGQINATLIKQFRMPGYPIMLITTDLLQEGEDLHTFCSSVYHYGISWMPSSMEQRVGRIDRVNSATERQLTKKVEPPDGHEYLQVYYPHLADTVEVLQVRRVLSRLNRFLRLMHKNLGQAEAEDRRLNLDAELSRIHEDIAPIREPLTSAFPIREEVLSARDRELAVRPENTDSILARFRSLSTSIAVDGLSIEWAQGPGDDALIGNVKRGVRQQPFTLLLRSIGGRVLIRCVSLASQLSTLDRLSECAEVVHSLPAQISVTWDERQRRYLLAAEGEVLLGAETSDARRVGWLLDVVTHAADRLEAHLDPDQDSTLDDHRESLEKEADRAD